VRLDQADIEAIAQRVAELLDDATRAVPVRLIDARELAEALGVDREWIYAHARQLGAVRLGGGQGRLRFDLQRALDALKERPPRPPNARRPESPRNEPPEAVELLPYDEVRSTRSQSGRAARQRPRL
jgi:hypothetical protein